MHKTNHTYKYTPINAYIQETNLLITIHKEIRPRVLKETVFTIGRHCTDDWSVLCSVTLTQKQFGLSSRYNILFLLSFQDDEVHQVIGQVRLVNIDNIVFIKQKICMAFYVAENIRMFRYVTSSVK